MAKGVVTAYALWAVGGPLGLHHLYLGRDSHALLWLLTLGGFGVGWAREIFRIPEYVGEANREAAGQNRRHHAARPPPVSLARFVGQVCVGIYFGTVALIGLNSLSFFYVMVLPLCVGAGVHLVSCAGHETSNLQKTLTACLITSPIFYGSTLSPLPISLAASVTAAQHRRFKRPHPSGTPPDPLAARLYRLGLAWLAFSAPLGYCVFHNTTATLYYLSDCVAALLDALWFLPWLRDVLEFFLLLPYRILCAVTGGGGAEDSWRKVLEILLREHSQREKEALKVLSVSEDASIEDITRSYRELVKVWHPDHNPNRMLEAQQMFIKIQEAYETLLRRHNIFRKK
ncbi:dnaJ homolog subfamily C member 22 [Megalops cyprinoides]|uniref:dnaJ homolog subfamily C member 22 n=1 Tax=Megalops cyprinoides TaxID=118141 RepID=UPI0018641E50|nr:dnaJ homolog subfamily C member 22 [Megalops cyprinoides]